MGHAGRHRRVPQPDSRPRARAREPFGSNDRILARRFDGDILGARRRRREQQRYRDLAVPTLGGELCLYAEGAAEFDRSPDGATLVYHTPGPGDPTYVRRSTEPGEGRELFSAAPGLHSHFPTWSPDGRFIYFVQGSVSGPMDIWRIGAHGGSAERITSQNHRSATPSLPMHARCWFLARDSGRLGPVAAQSRRRAANRASFSSTIDRYTSISVTADGRRLVATIARPKRTLWRSGRDAPARASEARQSR